MPTIKAWFIWLRDVTLVLLAIIAALGLIAFLFWLDKVRFVL